MDAQVRNACAWGADSIALCRPPRLRIQAMSPRRERRVHRITECLVAEAKDERRYQVAGRLEDERERERGRDIGRGRSRLHAPGARRGTRSQVSRIAPWAKGRRQTSAPPRDPRSKHL
ncbi:unnamed protein product [Nyctereutes procyonoides]|uniref:(raccoon dog) hypothetical protein n=1 Tax=Nyctereutes procyonoides TaxID=34880 RepID=A0A811ZLS3_NYCPR|nr:unnamed protein product [Nyctereutes procyonoides]CAD7689573.1 unnamed protein product [Nyctereutes procyonoides]